MYILSFFSDLGIEFNDFKNDIIHFFKNIYNYIQEILTKYLGEDGFLIISIFLIAILAISVFRSIINKR